MGLKTAQAIDRLEWRLAAFDASPYFLQKFLILRNIRSVVDLLVKYSTYWAESGFVKESSYAAYEASIDRAIAVVDRAIAVADHLLSSSGRSKKSSGLSRNQLARLTADRKRLTDLRAAVARGYAAGKKPSREERERVAAAPLYDFLSNDLPKEL